MLLFGRRIFILEDHNYVVWSIFSTASCIADYNIYIGTLVLNEHILKAQTVLDIAVIFCNYPCGQIISLNWLV